MENIVHWASTIIIALGLAGTWWRNGRDNAKMYGELTKTVELMSKKIDKMEITVESANRHSMDMKVNCASVTSTFSEQIRGLSREIREIKEKIGGR